MRTPRLSILAALGLGLATTAGAQTAITITDAGYPMNIPATDTFTSISNPPAFSSLGTAGINQNWDLSNVIYSGTDYYQRETPVSSPFAGATYRSPLYTSFATGLQYTTSGYYSLSSSGISRIGEQVLLRQVFPLGLVTGGSTDSVVFPVQTISYTGGTTPLLVFPATFGNHWSSSVGSTLNFSLTVMPVYNNAPGERRILRTAHDTVVGWGRMRVENEATGQLSGWMNVLQVRSNVSVRDSFYLNGSPVPAALLTQFGLQQGQITNTTYVRFYRAGEFTPLVEVIYGPSSPAGIPSQVLVSQMRLASPTTGVGSLDAADAVTLFPNPARGGAVGVKLPAGQTFSYQLISVTGAVLREGTLKSSAAGTASVALPAESATGIYYLVLQSEATGRLVLPFEVQQ